MAESPFDDEASQPAPSGGRRPRRPWWRWNVITLFATLFLLVWVRQLGNLSPGWTWTLVLSVFTLWAVAPLLLVEPRILAAPPGGLALPWQGRRDVTPMVVAFVRRLALLVVTVSLLSLCLSVFWGAWTALGSGYGPRDGNFRWEGVLVGVLTSLAVFALASIVYLLGVIADRLERAPREH